MHATTMLRDATILNTKTPELGDHVRIVKRDLNELGRAAGTTAKLKLNQARDRGEKLVQHARSKSAHVVKKRPLTAVGTALAVGALAGLILGWK